jgi:hypothetical protein
MTATFYIERPTFTGESPSKQSLAVYTTAAGEDLLWSGCRCPLPDIGATILITMNSIGPAQVVGYFKEGGYLGVMTHAVNPPQWLIDQRARDRENPRHATKPQWWKDGIGCEFGTEIADL